MENLRNLEAKTLVFISQVGEGTQFPVVQILFPHCPKIALSKANLTIKKSIGLCLTF